MKKLFVTMLVVVASLSVTAATTSAIRIKLVGSNPTYATSLLRLTEDNARTAAYESGYDAESMMSLSNPYSVLIYSYVETHPCEVVMTNNLNNTNVGFTTNLVDQNYTLEFSNFEGNELRLYDAVEDSTIVLNASTPAYAFSVTAAQVGRIQVLDRFIINPARELDDELEICHKDNKLELHKNPYAENIVVKDAEGNIVKDVPSTNTPQYIDLSDLAAGQYTVELNGGNRKFVIKQ